jgi:hypothetical protein
VLGLTIVSEYAHWAEDPAGPLMLSPDGGKTKLALFEDPELSSRRGGFDQVAFRITGPGFVAPAKQLDTLGLRNRNGEKLSAASLSDHGGAYSFHFLDPWGHRLEVTTYDCEYIREYL